MDDDRIRQLADEVLSQIAGPRDPQAADLETRVAALEAAVGQLKGAAPVAAAALPVVVARATALVHPALQLLDVPSGTDRCVLEPDQPCTQSGRCRAFGH